MVFLAENARIPVDDPTTHLELTMIHEVMVLDHGGPDLAFILYGAALKLWVSGRCWSGSSCPSAAVDVWLDGCASRWQGCSAVAVVTASSSPPWRGCGCCACRSLLVGAGVLSALALVLMLR